MKKCIHGIWIDGTDLQVVDFVYKEVSKLLKLSTSHNWLFLGKNNNIQTIDPNQFGLYKQSLFGESFNDFYNGKGVVESIQSREQEISTMKRFAADNGVVLFFVTHIPDMSKDRHHANCVNYIPHMNSFDGLDIKIITHEENAPVLEIFAKIEAILKDHYQI